MRLPIYLSIYRSIDRSIYRFVDLSIYRSVGLSIYLSIYLSFCLSIYVSICRGGQMYIYNHLHLRIHVRVHTHAHIHTRTYTYQQAHIQMHEHIHLHITDTCMYIHIAKCSEYTCLRTHVQLRHIRMPVLHTDSYTEIRIYTRKHIPNMFRYRCVTCSPFNLTSSIPKILNPQNSRVRRPETSQPRHRKPKARKTHS